MFYVFTRIASKKELLDGMTILANKKNNNNNNNNNSKIKNFLQHQDSARRKRLKAPQFPVLKNQKLNYFPFTIE